MNLWKVEESGLKEVSRSKFDKEDRLEKRRRTGIPWPHLVDGPREVAVRT